MLRFLCPSLRTSPSTGALRVPRPRSKQANKDAHTRDRACVCLWYSQSVRTRFHRPSIAKRGQVLHVGNNCAPRASLGPIGARCTRVPRRRAPRPDLEAPRLIWRYDIPYFSMSSLHRARCCLNAAPSRPKQRRSRSSFVRKWLDGISIREDRFRSDSA